jgi:hypothetical protein
MDADYEPSKEPEAGGAADSRTPPKGGALDTPPPDEVRRHLSRILESSTFANAPTLRCFLQFVVSLTLDGQSRKISQYAVAREVFRKPADFDAAADTIVRTQAFRLREKLRSYYTTEGIAEPVLIDLPKGHYVPLFSRRPLSGGDAAPERPPEERRAKALMLRFAPYGLIGLVLFGLGIIVGLYWLSGVRDTHAPGGVPNAASDFWAGLAATSEPVVISYSNAAFLLTDYGDLLRFKGSPNGDRGMLVDRETARRGATHPRLLELAGPLTFDTGYTGTGEVLSVHRLTYMLSLLRAETAVYRSPLVTAEVLRHHNVVVLGSPFQNETLSDLQRDLQFVFRLPKSPEAWKSVIWDRGSKPEAFFGLERDPRSQVILADYGIFAVLPGIAPGRRIVILAGITTSGTQGAVEFAISPEGMRELTEAIGVTQGRRKVLPDYFECLLRVQVIRGMEAMKVHYVRGRSLPGKRGAGAGSGTDQ